MLKLYNTYAKKKQNFVSIEANKTKIYSCGPTVYSKQHIGNLRAALFSDFLKRTLRFFNYEVIDVVNITDVGHLTSDSDEGEDKMLKAMKKEQKDPFEIARFYEEIYKNDLKSLNIILPKYMPRATEHIDEQITIIQQLENNGYTYITQDGVYFDVAKFKEYGMLSGQSLQDKKPGGSGRVQIGEKRNPEDFALWKFLTGDNLNHIMKWESPWGIGFPGWHIECSAMSKKYLGDKFDIHTGGIDHIPIHHENEIAQNTCSGCIKAVNYWIHNEFMRINDEKMSKSLGNIHTLDDITALNYSPLAFREVCLRAHYRKQMNFSLNSLKSAQASVRKYNEFYITINSLKELEGESHIKEMTNKYLQEFKNALEDDINTPEALASVHEYINEINKMSSLSSNDKKEALSFIENVDRVLGLLEKREEIPKTIIQLAEQRKEAKQKKDFQTADSIRDKIQKRGYEIKDSNQAEKGYILEKKK